MAGLDPDDGTSTAIKTDREGFLIDHPRYAAYAAFMRGLVEKHARVIEDDNDRRRDQERKAKLSEAVANVTEVFNAFNEQERRLMLLAQHARQPGQRTRPGPMSRVPL